MSKSQRTKGHNFERWTVRQFKPLYDDAQRNLDDVHGASGVDVYAGPWRIQCKSYKAYAPISKISEIQEDGLPLLVTKGDYMEPMAVLPLSLLLEILNDVGVAYE